MAVPINLVTISQMRDYVDIAATFPDIYMNRHIGAAQTQYIRPLLGDTLYEAIESQFAASTLTTSNTALVAELVPLITFRAYQIYITWANINNTPMGMRVYKEDNSESLNNEQVNRLSRYAQGQAESYTQQVVRFLNQNIADYSTWVGNCENANVKYTANITTLRRPDRDDWKPLLGTGRTLRKNP